MRALLVGILAAPLVVFAAEPCQQPRPRNTAPLTAAITADEQLAASFDSTAQFCGTAGDPCDQAKLKCGDLLAATLKRQAAFDEGQWLRDMLLVFNGQNYKLTTPIAQAAPLTDVSCSAEPAVLLGAAQRRRAQAERRKTLLAEYPLWVRWSEDVTRQCQDKAKLEDSKVAQAAAAAAALAATAEAARIAEQVKQDSAKAALEAANKLKEEQEKKVREAAEMARRDKEKQEQELKDRADAEKRAREDADAKAKREKEEALAAAEAAKLAAVAKLEKDQRDAEEKKIIDAREAKKGEAKARKEALLEKEKQRQAEVAKQREASRQGAAAAHQKKIEELKKNLALTEEARALALAEEDKKFDETEKARSAEALKAAEEAGKFDDSDERSAGAISAQVAGGYLGIVKGPTGGVIGGQVGFRLGLFGTAPAEGMASGFEIRAVAQVFTAVGLPADNSLLMVNISPEVRYWIGRLGIGAGFEYQLLNTKFGTTTGAGNTIAIGPNLAFAFLDNRQQRLVLMARWLPGLNNGNLQRFNGELEFSFGYFSASVLAGTLQDRAAGVKGFFVGASAGVRLKW